MHDGQPRGLLSGELLRIQENLQNGSAEMATIDEATLIFEAAGIELADEGYVDLAFVKRLTKFWQPRSSPPAIRLATSAASMRPSMAGSFSPSSWVKTLSDLRELVAEGHGVDRQQAPGQDRRRRDPAAGKNDALGGEPGDFMVYPVSAKSRPGDRGCGCPCRNGRGRKLSVYFTSSLA